MLSVSGNSQIRLLKMASLHVSRLLLVGTMIAPSTGFAQSTGYERYEAAGSPQLNRMVYDRESGQWGYWSVPGGEQGYERGEDDPEPLNREGLRERRGPRPMAPGGYSYGYTVDDDQDERPRPPRIRRPRRSAAPRAVEAPINPADERNPWSPGGTPTARPVAPSPRPAPVSRPDLPQSDAVPSAASTRRTGEAIPSPKSQLEAGCEPCAVGAGAARTTPERTSNEVLKAVDPKVEDKRKEAEVEAKRGQAKVQGERTNSKFVERLLKYAAIEANKRVRFSGGVRYQKKYTGGGMGLCLQGVRMAVQKAAGHSTAGTIGDGLAKHAGPALVREYGYQKVTSRSVTPRNAPDGSILIYQALGDPGHAGHIEIKGNGGYMSDYYNTRPINELSSQRRLIGIYTPPQA